MSAPDDFGRLWSLDPAVTFLNHGSFGACPTAILEYQAHLRTRLEREPVRFFLRDLEGLLDEARRELGGFVGADPEDLAFVPNATTGVNTVLRSLKIEPGDELLTTDHAYPACRNAIDFVAARDGARVVVARVPFPLSSEDDAVAAILGAVTARTRLAMLDHVTSPTALVLPAARIVAEVQARGVDVLVDGAHAPGMIDLDLGALGAAYYVGNCHKWLCAPKGAGFLHVRKDRQRRIRPLVISHGASATRTDRSRFHLEFDWTGTDDPTPFLAAAESIRYLAGLLPGGWNAIRQRNRLVALAARQLVGEALGVRPPCPEAMVGSMAAVPLPDGPPGPPGDDDPLGDALARDHGVRVVVFPWPAPPRRVLRISTPLYVSGAQLRRLADALALVRHR